jgi:hypothetical protein
MHIHIIVARGRYAHGAQPGKAREQIRIDLFTPGDQYPALVLQRFFKLRGGIFRPGIDLHVEIFPKAFDDVGKQRPGYQYLLFHIAVSTLRFL